MYIPKLQHTYERTVIQQGHRGTSERSRHEYNIPFAVLELGRARLEVLEVNHMLLQLLDSGKIVLWRDTASKLANARENLGLKEFSEKMLSCCTGCADY